MIKSSSAKATIEYIMDDKKSAVVIAAEGVYLDSIASIIHSFEVQHSMRPNITKPIYHIPISFSPEDAHKVDNDLMREVAEDYLQMMGLRNTQYVAVRHFDKKRPHFHLCINRIDNDGKLISDKHNFIQNEKVCKRLTEKYGLHFSIGGNENHERLRHETLAKLKIKEALTSTLRYTNDWVLLAFRLKEKGVKMDFKMKSGTSKAEGVKFTYDGLTFSGSKIDRNLSLNKIQALFDSRELEMSPFPQESVMYQRLYEREMQKQDNNAVEATTDLVLPSETELGGGVNNELPKRKRR